jgi:glycosyltransferase involved in cell wall biosynthesis
VPVVTSRVAAGGVDAQDHHHFLVCDGRDDYVRAITRLMDDASERRRLAVAGRERILSHHAWDQSMRRLDRIIERCLEAGRAGIGNSNERALQT